LLFGGAAFHFGKPRRSRWAGINSGARVLAEGRVLEPAIIASGEARINGDMPAGIKILRRDFP